MRPITLEPFAIAFGSDFGFVGFTHPKLLIAEEPKVRLNQATLEHARRSFKGPPLILRSACRSLVARP